MKEKRKTIIIISIIVTIILLIVTAALSSIKKGDVKLKEVELIFSYEKAGFLLIGRDDCKFSQAMRPILQNMAAEYNFEYSYLNTNEVNDGQLKKITDMLDIEDLVTPYLLVVKKQKVLGTIQGEQQEKTIFEFLQKNEIIDPSVVYQSNEIKYPNINFLTYEQYEKIYDNQENQVLALGKRSCEACVLAKTALNNIATNGLKVNFVEIDDLTTNEASLLFSGITYFDNKERWGTPLMFTIKDGKIDDYYEGFSSEKDYRYFLNEEGLLVEKTDE